jgi:hypothetical protein
MTETKDEMLHLFNQARKYGRVCIFTARDGTYSCQIEFNCIDHVELKAKSGHNMPSPISALKEAIKAAEKIITNISKLDAVGKEQKPEEPKASITTRLIRIW